MWRQTQFLVDPIARGYRIENVVNCRPRTVRTNLPNSLHVNTHSENQNWWSMIQFFYNEEATEFDEEQN
jgi:hypothetical protein